MPFSWSRSPKCKGNLSINKDVSKSSKDCTLSQNLRGLLKNVFDSIVKLNNKFSHKFSSLQHDQSVEIHGWPASFLNK